MALRRRVFRVLAARALWTLVAVLPACAASQEWIYEKSRTTPAQLDRDKTACRKIARDRTVFNAFDEDKVDRTAFNRCMQSRGYTVKVAPLP